MPPKRKRRRAAGAATKTRLTLRISIEAATRLAVTVAMERIKPGDLVEQLILERSRRWVVQDRQRESGETESAA